MEPLIITRESDSLPGDLRVETLTEVKLAISDQGQGATKVLRQRVIWTRQPDQHLLGNQVELVQH